MEPGLRRPPSPLTGWRSIRPWNRLTLHVREITPVSATFILSSSLALRTWEDSDELEDSDHAGPSHSKPPVKPSSMSELLGKGLAVKINNAPWQRVVMHIDDDADTEAIVILYGLHPARTYDVELALVATEDLIRGKVSTEAASEPPHSYGHLDTEDTPAADDSLEDDTPILPSATQGLTPAATRPASPALPEPHRAMTIEERASQLLHELTTLGEEKETIATRLKTARRESQRADAALRSEIEALKRASEKSAQADQRNRQKILALQEATKQSLAASVEADEQVKLVEASLPRLEERAKAVEIEYQRIKEKASKEHSASTEAMKADKKQINDLEAELVALNHRLERLTARKDKLAMETVPELERELGQLGRKIEEAERSGTQTPPMSDDAHGDQSLGLSRRLSQPTSQQPGNWTSYPFGWNPLGSSQEPLAQRCR